MIVMSVYVAHSVREFVSWLFLFDNHFYRIKLCAIIVKQIAFDRLFFRPMESFSLQTDAVLTVLTQNEMIRLLDH